jgi:hypothetical protein
MLLSLFVVFICASNGNAHPPKNMTVQYDADVQMLNITIDHPVKDPSKHYIKEVKIEKNGKPVDSYPYTTQPGKSPFTYTYKVPAQSGDTIKVRVKCSILGSKTGTLRIF